ncbi:MAG: MMPL family transporter [Myxococcota bacterium]
MAVVVAVTALGAASARQLSVNTSVEALLPADSDSVRSLERLREELAVDQPLTVLVSSNDGDTSLALASQIADEFGSWPEARWVMTDYGFDAIAERALYYVDVETLDEWNDLATEALEWEVCEASPLCVTIADPPTLPGEADVIAAVERSDAGRMLDALTGETTSQEHVSGSDPTPLCKAGVCAVQVMLDGDAGDLAFARKIQARANRFIEPLEAAQVADTQIRVVGRYRVAPLEQAIITHDLERIAVLAAIGSLLVVLLFFGDLRAVLQLGLPMLTGLVAAVGVIAFVDPELNIISASALAILAGMAIDFGIHLLMHHRSTHSSGEGHMSPTKSVRELWVSLTVAGVTTACGFAALSLTDFKGFSQMGWMASVGILVALVWTMAVFPTAVYFLRGRDRRPASAVTFKVPRHRAIAIAGVALGVLAVPLSAGVRFERNLASLQPEIVHHGINAEVLGARRFVPVLLLGRSSDDVDRALNGTAMIGARDILGVEPIPVSAQAVFPADADEKTRAIGNLRDTLERARSKAVDRQDEETLEAIADLEPWLATRPPEPRDLPPWLATTLVDANDQVGRSGILYVPLRGSDAEAMERLAAWLDALRHENPNVEFASAEAMLGEVTPALIRDAPLILGLVFLGLILATGIASRSWAVTRDVFMATALTGLLFAGALALVGLELHLYNLLAVPVVIGLAVDGAVHMRWAQREASPERAGIAARAVAASTLTSMVAFVALATASHPGLRSLGIVGALGLGISLAVNLVWLPAWGYAGIGAPSSTRQASEL